MMKLNNGGIRRVMLAKSPSRWEGRPKAGEGELIYTSVSRTSPSPRFARPSQREGDLVLNSIVTSHGRYSSEVSLVK